MLLRKSLNARDPPEQLAGGARRLAGPPLGDGRAHQRVEFLAVRSEFDDELRERGIAAVDQPVAPALDALEPRGLEASASVRRRAQPPAVPGRCGA